MLPGVRLQIQHRCGKRIQLPVYFKATIGKDPHSDILITGHRVPKRLCTIYYRYPRYWLHQPAHPPHHMRLKGSVELQGFILSLYSLRTRRLAIVTISLFIGYLTCNLLPGLLTANQTRETKAPLQASRPSPMVTSKEVEALTRSTRPLTRNEIATVVHYFDSQEFAANNRPLLDKLAKTLTTALQDMQYQVMVQLGVGRGKEAAELASQLQQLLPPFQSLQSDWLKRFLFQYYDEIYAIEDIVHARLG